MTHYDLIIIGTGSGNSILDERYAGMKTAIVEKGIFGGTCLNVGCIPTKMFVYAAEIATSARESSRYGVDASVQDVRWPDIRDRIFGRIDPIAEGGRRYRSQEQENVTVYASHAHFTDPNTLVTEHGESLSWDRLVIAAGAHADIPDIPGLDAAQVADPTLPVHTSDTVMRLEELPDSMIVLGSGFIASELAHVFSALGTEVTMIARSSHLLRSQDADISARFTERALDQWDVRLNAAAGAVRVSPDGVELDYVHGGQTVTVSAATLLVATGRIPSTAGLGASAAGFDLHDDGRLAVDEFQRVLSGGAPVDGVFALGDICSEYQLKHVANHEARVVADNLLVPAGSDGELRASDHRFVPSAVFSRPQIAAVGLTEDQAKRAGYDCATVLQDYGSVAYGWAMEDTTGFVKLIADKKTGLLLGAHIVGHEASMIIQPLIQAMSFGLGAKEMARGQYWIHPALPEVVENALLSLDLP